MNYVWVFLGGGLGSAFRFGISRMIYFSLGNIFGQYGRLHCIGFGCHVVQRQNQ
jgi:fluoride ion exporter CrcB/FEX